MNEKRAAVGLEPVAGGDRLTPAPGRPGADGGGPPGPFDGGLAPASREAKRAEPEARPDLDPVFVKVWRTQKDGSVRASHRAADGQIRFEDEFFDVGAAKLREPRDPAGPPEETINCRCIVERLPITALKGEERQRAEARLRIAQRRGRGVPARFTPGELAARAQWFNAMRIIRQQNPDDPILSGIASPRFVPTGEQLREVREIARVYQTMRFSRHATDRRKQRGVPLHLINEALRKGRESPGSRPDTVIIELSASESSTGRGVRVIMNPRSNRIVTVYDLGRKK